AQYRIEQAEIVPDLDASGGANFSRNNPARLNSGTGAVSGGGVRTVYDAQIGLSAFEIDLFGRLRSLSRAALQQYLGTEAAVRTARLSLVGEIATAYLTLATDRSLLAIAVDTEASAARSVELTRARQKGGIAPRSDLRQAETVLAQARSDRADLITAVAQDRNLLELLVGGPVGDGELPPSIESVDGLLGELPAGLDSRILLRRPDVVQAEYQLRAENARIGAARAAFFPTISLTSAVGFASTALSGLFSGGAFTWSAAPGVSLPIFDGGARSGNLAFARAQRDVALAGYQRAIQIAFREVADALARRGTIDRQLAAQRELEAAASDNFMLAEARYREGIEPFLNTLDAQRTLYGARRSLASARLLRANNLVALYRVLGGDMLVDMQPVAGAKTP
ncbi:MAG: efflux transporter outer rane subunit, partial [Sphingomonas bacterium]|nr:efflux transporter outer rane subunit [Sphingomonas bacterium]